MQNPVLAVDRIFQKKIVLKLDGLSEKSFEVLLQLSQYFIMK